MTNVVFKSAIPQSVQNLNDYLTIRLMQMVDNMGMDYVENLQMVIEFNNGESWKVVPTWWSPAGFTGFDYGKAEDMDAADESLLDSDDFIEEPEQMAGILVQAIRAREGFTLIEVTGDVADEDVVIAQSLQTLA